MIQSAWRAREGRQAFMLARAAKIAAEQEQERAASKLQTIYRGRLARKKMLRKKQAKQEHANEEEAAAIKLQAQFRGMKARRLRQAKIREAKEREKAAIKIQSIYRARTGRMAMYMKKSALRAEEEEKAAIRIQNAWRMRQGRMAVILIRAARAEEEKERERAARKLQRIYRGHQGRKAYKKQQQKVVIARKKQENLEEWAAIKVQKTFRGKLGRQRFKARQVEVAMRWKTMFDEDQQRPFYYNMNTGEIRWRKPQMLLELDPRPPCDNCATTEAIVECGACHEFFARNVGMLYTLEERGRNTHFVAYTIITKNVWTMEMENFPPSGQVKSTKTRCMGGISLVKIQEGIEEPIRIHLRLLYHLTKYKNGTNIGMKPAVHSSTLIPKVPRVRMSAHCHIVPLQWMKKKKKTLKKQRRGANIKTRKITSTSIITPNQEKVRMCDQRHLLHQRLLLVKGMRL